MKKSKAERLRNAGWAVGSTQEFLGLNDEEMALIDIKLALARCVKERRLSQELTQSELARRIGSSQSRIAKMESADPTVTVDLLIRCLLALDSTRRDIGKIIGAKARPSAA